MTSNPMTQDNVYQNYEMTAEPMTIAGATNKALLLLGIVAFVSIYTWQLVFTGFMDKAMILFWGGLIAGLILAIVMRFKPQQAKLLSIAYAVCEGLAIGTLSAMYETQFSGIVINAVGLTFATMFAMLMLYKFGVIKATTTFRKVIMTATLSVLIFYVVAIGASFFGATFMSPFFMGTIGIIVSLVIIVIAALNFILDFDFIEKGAQQLAPKYFEWYGAFALLVTLIWLYIEMLRLLAIITRRN